MAAITLVCAVIHIILDADAMLLLHHATPLAFLDEVEDHHVNVGVFIKNLELLFAAFGF